MHKARKLRFDTLYINLKIIKVLIILILSRKNLLFCGFLYFKRKDDKDEQ